VVLSQKNYFAFLLDFVALAQEMFTNDLQKINFSMPSTRNETEKNLSYVIEVRTIYLLITSHAYL